MFQNDRNKLLANLECSFAWSLPFCYAGNFIHYALYMCKVIYFIFAHYLCIPSPMASALVSIILSAGTNCITGLFFHLLAGWLIVR